MMLTTWPLSIHRAWRDLKRDWRSPRLRLLALALILTVMAVTAVGYLSQRLEHALERQSSTLLAADLVLESTAEQDVFWQDRARSLGLSVAHTRELRSMVQSRQGFLLSEIKAVDATYPLRGRLEWQGLTDSSRPVTSIPEPGTVWLDHQLRLRLQAQPGDSVRVGDLTLRIAGVLTHEPDRGMELFSIAPRLLMNLEDLPRTGLMQPGSLLKYRWLFAGEDDAVATLKQQLAAVLKPGERLLHGSEAQPELRLALRKGAQFLNLAALVSLLLAAAAIALAAHLHAMKSWPAAALLKCLGAGPRQIIHGFIAEMLLLGVLASCVGVLGGLFLQELLIQVAHGLLLEQLPPPTLAPGIQGFITGLAMLLGFSLPPVWRIREVPPLRVLRSNLDPPATRQCSGYVLAMLIPLGIMAWQLGEIRLLAWVLAGLTLILAILGFCAWGLILGLRRWPPRSHLAWRFGLANIQRRAALSVLQIMALGLGILALLVLSLVRDDLLHHWRKSLPAATPNFFLVNVQPGQQESIEQTLAELGVLRPTWFPMIRGRLVNRNGQPIRAEDFTDARAQRLLRREFNLTWMDRLPDDNRITAGQFWDTATSNPAQWSVEAGLAQTLSLNLGDTLVFQLPGDTLEAKITSLRTVEWGSFHPNFFVVAPPGILDPRSVSYLCSIHVPPWQQERLDTLIQSHPNITVVDVDDVLSRVRDILARMAQTVEIIVLFTVLLGGVILWTAIQTTREERQQEMALLRALGASRRQLRQVVWAEFLALGGLAGTIAGFGALTLEWALASRVLNIPFTPNPWILLLALLIGAAGAGLAGWLGVRKLLDLPPLRTLQSA